MDINSLDDLHAAERQIRRTLQLYKLDSVLLGLRRIETLPSIGRYPPIRLEPFMIAGAAMFALRYCPSSSFRKRYRPIHDIDLIRFMRLVVDYLLADPVSWDPTIQEQYRDANPIFTFLRLVASQFIYKVDYFGQYPRSLILYEELPPTLAARQDIPPFDLAAAFEALNGVPLTDYIKVGFVAWAAARSENRLGFTRNDFEQVRARGISLPGDAEILPMLDQITTTQGTFVAEYTERKNADRRFAMYDFNPLLLQPIVRPYQFDELPPPEEDAMVVPLPNLILSRVSVGIFYQLFNSHRTEFSQYFGHLFSEYVGVVLRNSLSSGTLLSEHDIRKTYSEEEGKVPDWVIIDGTTAILIECKSTRFTRAALTTGDEDAVNKSLVQTVSGLKQLNEFTKACEAKHPGLKRFHTCTAYKPILATLEPLYLTNSQFFREHIDQLLAADRITDLPWLILPVDELERLQPHLAAGMDLGETIDGLHNARFNEILQRLHEQTQLTYKDSFLYSKDEELFSSLGV